jgi:ketosteroid isomerase-like protein
MAEAANEIKELEDLRWRAQIYEDVDTLRRLFADEMSYTHSNALVDTKDSYLEAIANKVFDYRAEQRSDTTIRIVDDTALVTGRIAITVVAGGAERNLDARYSVVWVRRDDSWQFLCWQSTPVPR